MDRFKPGDKATLVHLNFEGVGDTPLELAGTEVTIVSDWGYGYLYKSMASDGWRWFAPDECFGPPKDDFARPELKTLRRMR